MTDHLTIGKSINCEDMKLIDCIKSARQWFALVNDPMAEKATSVLAIIEKKAATLEYSAKAMQRNYRAQKKKANNYKKQINNTIKNRCEYPDNENNSK